MVSSTELAGTDWGYDFLEIGGLGQDAKLGRPGLKNYAARTRPLFDSIVKEWSPKLHTQWLLRQYLALKLVMAASIQIGSADHAYEQNIQMAVPYLSYYAMFNAMRANLLTSPRTQWGKKTLAMGHDRAREDYAKELTFLLSEKEVAAQSKLAVEAKHGRELMSYRFPASGAPGPGGFYVYRDAAEKFSRFAAELALFNSFCLYGAVERRFGDMGQPNDFKADLDWLSEGWEHRLKGQRGEQDAIYPDDQDLYQLARLAQRVTKPVPFPWLVGEGGIEDFFGSFVSHVDDEDAFNPDEHWDRLVDLP
ncbi:hypothetical protein [Maricaulis sp.]|uniref:hypothetical protein n=1 Tax=Maricaulis sp. TaxID=1486257 RepID=UPI003A9505D3